MWSSSDANAAPLSEAFVRVTSTNMRLRELAVVALPPAVDNSDEVVAAAKKREAFERAMIHGEASAKGAVRP